MDFSLACTARWPIGAFIPLYLAGCGCSVFSETKSNAVRCAPTVAVAAVALPARPLMDKYQSYKAKKRLLQLEGPTTVARLELPVGTVVFLSETADRKSKEKLTFEDIKEITLPSPTPLFGAVLEKKIKPGMGRYWEVMLANDQIIDRWPCAAGRASFDIDGALRSCQLSSEYAFKGQVLPAKTLILVTPDRWVLSPPQASSIYLDR
jgi:hypothetical protein